jgi:hypothetical protein
VLKKPISGNSDVAEDFVRLVGERSALCRLNNSFSVPDVLNLGLLSWAFHSGFLWMGCVRAPNMVLFMASDGGVV